MTTLKTFYRWLISIILALGLSIATITGTLFLAKAYTAYYEPVESAKAFKKFRIKARV